MADVTDMRTWLWRHAGLQLRRLRGGDAVVVDSLTGHAVTNPAGIVRTLEAGDRVAREMYRHARAERRAGA